MVDFDIDDEGVKFELLSCGHRLRSDNCRPRKLNSHAQCKACVAEGNTAHLPSDKGSATAKPHFCRSCGCRLRSGQKNDYCDPCSGR